MRNFPPSKSAKVVLLLGLALTAVEALETLVLPFALGLPMSPPDIGGVSAYLVSASLIALTITLTAIVAFNRRAKYSYDEYGTYRRSRLLFDWHHVNKVTVSFKGSDREINLPVGPSLMAVLSGGPPNESPTSPTARPYPSFSPMGPVSS